MSLPKRPKPPGVSIGAARIRQAREFLVIHPDMSRSQVSASTGISEATIARARRDLVAEGTLSPARNAPPQPQELLPRTPDPDPSAIADAAEREGGAPPAAPPPSKKVGANTLLDSAALMELAAMADEAIESGDDETIQKKLSKQALVFAFRIDLHPDTRMSASQMYYKLKDMAKAKDLGPGKPKTYAIGVDRLSDMMVACGPEMTMAAVHKAFEVKEAQADVKQPPPQQQETAPAAPQETVEPSVTPPAPVEAPRAPDNVAKDPANPW